MMTATAHDVVRHDNRLQIFSPELGRQQEVIVWLPIAYRETSRNYPVVYAQDGQDVLADPRALDGWGRTLARPDAIIVGIVSDEYRTDNYTPFSDDRFGGGDGSRYLAFVADTLKPRIDDYFRTRPERECTGILGSSLGGLISIVALLTRGDVFGAAAALSPSVSFAEGALGRFVDSTPLLHGRAYVDAGTNEFGSQSELYLRRVRRFAQQLASKVVGRSVWYREIDGASHSGASWGLRLTAATNFLFSHEVA